MSATDWLRRAPDLRVLVCCHPRKFSYVYPTDGDHYLTPVIVQVITDKLHGATFRTVPARSADVKYVLLQTADAAAGGDLRADVFSDEFASAHAEEYDVVFAPDCAGVWAEAFASGDTEEQVALANKLLRVVKVGGQLVVSKLREPVRFANAFKSSAALVEYAPGTGYVLRKTEF